MAVILLKLIFSIITTFSNVITWLIFTGTAKVLVQAIQVLKVPGEGGQRVLEQVRNVTKTCLDYLMELIIAAISTLFSSLFDLLKEGVLNSSSGLVAALTGLVEILKTSLSNVVEDIPKVLDVFIEMVGKIVGDFLNNCNDAIGYVRENVLTIILLNMAGKKLMQAFVYGRSVGGVVGLKHVEIPVPSPSKGEVLIKLEATSLNPLDYKAYMLKVLLRPFLARNFPLIPATDVAGEVVEVGYGVKNFKPGDKVVAILSLLVGGGLSEYGIAKEILTVSRPPQVSLAEAAGLPIAGITAHMALTQFAHLKLDKTGPHKNILITNASGGVGHYAVQLAKLGNAHVTATCGARNLNLVKNLGADEVLDYKTSEGATLKSPSGKKYDAVVHCGPPIAWSVFEPNLSEDGMVIDLTPGPSSMWTFLVKKITFSKKKLLPLIWYPKGSNHQTLEHLVELVKDGKLKTIIDSKCPLSEAGEAWGKSIDGHATGKIIHVEIPVPSPSKGEVLIKLEATSLNPLDYKAYMLIVFLRPFLARNFPLIPATDVAGEVVEVGYGVKNFKPGDKVVAILSLLVGGGLSEYGIAKEILMVSRPPQVSPVEAAGLPIAGITAHMALIQSAHLKLDKTGPHKNILITNASEGVGHCAVQLAKLGNAHVTATCGARNLNLVKNLGMDEVIDYKTQRSDSQEPLR
ncbi:hypothetical protein BUALT_Bualt02G0002300 [Buddleja alternifolia]|uniref:Enoyl reductase (ER) domain-containing protein n=1 Tax=Buddleja alternifolia TaxID=168488 RepID=A0AAV6XWW8_9LAMI|nr:hypothetical protein BUALT_Bualt02G0002300 [Buddleja alternifolia]